MGGSGRDWRQRSALRVVLSQLAARPRDIAANADRVRSLLEEHPDADLVVVPELFLTGYQSRDPAELALTADDPVLAGIRETCARRGTAFIGGYVERSGGARPFNSLVVIGPDGTVAGNYRKTHLFGDERTAFEPGAELACVDVAGLTLAPMICFDVEIPEVARTLARAAPALFVAIAANMDPYREDHLIATRARALDNRTPLVYVNRVGSESGLTFVGGSRTVTADGRVEVDLGGDEQVVVVEVALRGAVDPAVDYLRQLRPELYR